jgi:hypothetical protein
MANVTVDWRHLADGEVPGDAGGIYKIALISRILR